MRLAGTLLALILLAGTAGTAGTAAASPAEHTRVLPCGLRVHVVADPSSPVVAASLWVRAGAAIEPDGFEGTTHLLEHLWFRGAGRYASGEARERIARAGGRLNATTNFDYTEFHATVRTPHADELIDVLLSALDGMKLTDADIESERRVVLEEIARRNDDANIRWGRALERLLFGDHPYGRGIVGTPAGIETIPAANVRVWNVGRYRPEMSCLVVVGNVDPHATVTSIERWAAARDLPARKPVATKVPPPRLGLGVRVVEREADVAQAHLFIGLPGPGPRSEDDAAFRLLRDFVGGRARVALTDLALRSHGYVALWGERSMLGIQATLEPGASTAAAAAVLRVLADLRENGVTEREVRDGRDAFTSGIVVGRESAAGRAAAIGWADVIGTLGSDGATGFFTRDAARHREISRADIARVASRYLRVDDLAIVLVHPRGRRHKLDLTSLRAVLDRLRTDEPMTDLDSPARIEPIDQAPAKPDGTARGESLARDATTRTFTLANGLRVLHRPRPARSVSSVGVYLPAGAIFDPADRRGTAAATVRALAGGSVGRRENETEWGLYRLGNRYRLIAYDDFVSIEMTVPSDRLDRALALAADVTVRPSFPADAVRRTTALLRRQRARDAELVSGAAASGAYRALFGTSPYALDTRGEPESLQKIRRADLLAFHARHYRPDTAVLVVVSDRSTPEVRRLAEAAFGGWPRPEEGPPARPRIERHPIDTRVVPLRLDGREGAYVLVGFRGPTRRDAGELAAFHVLRQAISNAINRRLKDELGLAYSAGAFDDAYLEDGLLAAYGRVSPANVDRARKEIEAILDRFRRGDLDPELIEESRLGALGAIDTSSQSARALSGRIGSRAVLGLDPASFDSIRDGIESLTLSEVLKVAKRRLARENAITILVNAE